MSHVKKKLSKGLTRKKLSDINPRDFTVMGASSDFVHFNPSGEAMSLHPISHKLEKWILIVLLAFAMAAFMGFKLLENSDLSFSMNDNPTKSASANSLSSEDEFKSEFVKNRKEARALMEQHSAAIKITPKYGKGAIKLYAKKAKNKNTKKVAKKSSNKKRVASKASNKKAIARR